MKPPAMRPQPLWQIDGEKVVRGKKVILADLS